MWFNLCYFYCILLLVKTKLKCLFQSPLLVISYAFYLILNREGPRGILEREAILKIRMEHGALKAKKGMESEALFDKYLTRPTDASATGGAATGGG